MPYGLKKIRQQSERSDVLVNMFLELSFLDWESKVDKMNSEVEASKARCKRFTKEEFLIGLGLLIGAAEFSQKGVDLFGGKKVKMMTLTLLIGLQLAPAPPSKSLWLLADSKIFVGFFPQSIQIRAEKKLIYRGSFPAPLMSLI